jgi:nickel-type superoxide dismutase
LTLSRTAFALINRLFRQEDASAHCDIPCGIYDPYYAQIAALSVLRMVQMIEALEPPAMDKEARDKYMHAIARLTKVRKTTPRSASTRSASSGATSSSPRTAPTTSAS